MLETKELGTDSTLTRNTHVTLGRCPFFCTASIVSTGAEGPAELWVLLQDPYACLPTDAQSCSNSPAVVH